MHKIQVKEDHYETDVYTDHNHDLCVSWNCWNNSVSDLLADSGITEYLKSEPVRNEKELMEKKLGKSSEENAWNVI